MHCTRIDFPISTGISPNEGYVEQNLRCADAKRMVFLINRNGIVFIKKTLKTHWLGGSSRHQELLKFSYIASFPVMDMAVILGWLTESLTFRALCLFRKRYMYSVSTVSRYYAGARRVDRKGARRRENPPPSPRPPHKLTRAAQRPTGATDAATSARPRPRRRARARRPPGPRSSRCRARASRRARR